MSYHHFQVDGCWLDEELHSPSVSENFTESCDPWDQNESEQRDSSSSLLPSLQVKRAGILVAPPPRALASGSWRAHSLSAHLWPPPGSTPGCLACRVAPGREPARRPGPRPRGSPSPWSCRRQTPGEEVVSERGRAARAVSSYQQNTSDTYFKCEDCKRSTWKRTTSEKVEKGKRHYNKRAWDM